MDSCRLSSGFTGVKKLNNAGYVNFKLWAKYSILTVFFVCVGAWLYHIWGDKIPNFIKEDISFLWFPTVEHKPFVDFFATILYNSVDIFKISFIILISGFTYLSGVIVNFSNAIFGINVGISLCYCVDMIEKHDYGVVKLATAWTAMALYCLLVVSNCVCSVLTSQKFSEYRNVNVLLTSECFWRYIGRFLVSFGCVLIVCIFYVLIFKFVV